MEVVVGEPLPDLHCLQGDEVLREGVPEGGLEEEKEGAGI